jgi:hypothetical protein
MDELSLLKDLHASGSPALIAMSIIYFARQLKNSIIKLEEGIEVIDQSLLKLNLTITKLIVERDYDKKDIENIKTDLKQVSWRIDNGNKSS